MGNNVSLDSKAGLIEHAQIIRNKRQLRLLYTDFYEEIARNLPRRRLRVVELGSGGGFITEIIPGVITSDVIQAPGIKKVISAENIPYAVKSVDAFVTVNVFHHIKAPSRALNEMSRCLRTGGKIIMIEPWNTSWSRFVYQHFHHEVFDPAAGWHVAGRRRMSDANGALPWIIFHRDRNRFHKEFPNLTLQTFPHTPLGYLLSGGLSKPQLVPSPIFKLIRAMEKSSLPFSRWGAMFATIILTKNA